MGYFYFDIAKNAKLNHLHHTLSMEETTIHKLSYSVNTRSIAFLSQAMKKPQPDLCTMLNKDEEGKLSYDVQRLQI